MTRKCDSTMPETSTQSTPEVLRPIGCCGARRMDESAAPPDAVTFYSSLGFTPIDLISGALGDRPEPIAMFLSTRQIATAITDADRLAEE